MTHSGIHQRGDTIVEVLMSVAVLGLVFGAAHVTSNQNVLAGRATQERLEAVKLAETQIERLRIAISENESIFNRSGSFCIPSTDTPGSALVIASNNACTMSSNGSPAAATVAPRYRVSVQKTGDLTSAGVTGARFEVSVNWEANDGDDDDSLKTLYEVYR